MLILDSFLFLLNATTEPAGASFFDNPWAIAIGSAVVAGLLLAALARWFWRRPRPDAAPQARDKAQQMTAPGNQDAALCFSRSGTPRPSDSST